MELFEIIPPSLFTILTSKNRDTYVNALMILRQAFKQDVMLDKEVLVSQLTTKLQSHIYDIDANADEVEIKESLKDAASYARFIIRRFHDTGWLDLEYGSTSRLQEFVTIPPYSVKLMNLMYDLINEENEVYDSYLFNMYSSLKNADVDYKEFRYTALESVQDKIAEFEDVLKSLFHNLKRRYTNLSSLKTINQVLYEHFDSYQKTVIKQIYLPFKTKDSINRFKGPMLNILTSWMRDTDSIEKMIGQAIVQNRYKNEDDARWGILGMFNYIVDKLTELEELVNLIDERNQTYVQASTEKMRYLLRKDKSIKGKLSKIIEKIAKEREDNDFTSLGLVQDVITLKSQNNVHEDALFSRSQMNKNDYDNEPLEVFIMDETRGQELLIDFEKTNENVARFSSSSILKFMHEQMDELDVLSSRDIKIQDTNTLIMFMFSFIRGYDARMFYRLRLTDNENIINGDYEIPDFEFVRKKVR